MPFITSGHNFLLVFIALSMSTEETVNLVKYCSLLQHSLCTIQDFHAWKNTLK